MVPSECVLEDGEGKAEGGGRFMRIFLGATPSGGADGNVRGEYGLRHLGALVNDYRRHLGHGVVPLARFSRC